MHTLSVTIICDIILSVTLLSAPLLSVHSLPLRIYYDVDECVWVCMKRMEWWGWMRVTICYTIIWYTIICNTILSVIKIVCHIIICPTIDLYVYIMMRMSAYEADGVVRMNACERVGWGWHTYIYAHTHIRLSNFFMHRGRQRTCIRTSRIRYFLPLSTFFRRLVLGHLDP